MVRVPSNVGRVHPLVVSRAAQDKDFTKHFLSATTTLSVRAILLYIGGFALFLLLLLFLVFLG